MGQSVRSTAHSSARSDRALWAQPSPWASEWKDPLAPAARLPAGLTKSRLPGEQGAIRTVQQRQDRVLPLCQNTFEVMGWSAPNLGGDMKSHEIDMGTRSFRKPLKNQGSGWSGSPQKLSAMKQITDESIRRCPGTSTGESCGFMDKSLRPARVPRNAAQF